MCGIAIKYMMPVMLLTDGYIANGSEPWLIPNVDDAAASIAVKFRDRSRTAFHPYQRDPKTLARPWALPGTPGLEHRIGGLEKTGLTGNVSYDPDNHEHMVRLRAAKVAGIAKDIPRAEDRSAPAAASCWWSAGAARTAPCATAVRDAAAQGIASPTRTCAT